MIRIKIGIIQITKKEKKSTRPLITSACKCVLSNVQGKPETKATLNSTYFFFNGLRALPIIARLSGYVYEKFSGWVRSL